MTIQIDMILRINKNHFLAHFSLTRIPENLTHGWLLLQYFLDILDKFKLFKLPLVFFRTHFIKRLK